jgi:tetratricopeptide (TPR) repeat protein
MSKITILRVAVIAAILGLLAGCQDSDERADRHFRNAMELMEAGDTARAAVEFRTVFNHDGFHREARSNYAAMLMRQGDIQQAYAQYLRLVEQYPDDVDGRVALALISIELQNWAEARRHGRRALELVPADDPAAAVIAVNLDYVDAVDADDETAMREAFETASAMLEEDSENLLLRTIVIDMLLRDGELEAGLAELDRALSARPDVRLLQDARVNLLSQLNRAPELELSLRDMIRLFPEDEGLPMVLLRLYLSLGDLEAAETFLRGYAARTENLRDRHAQLEMLVELRLRNGGIEGAMEELDRIIAEEEARNGLFRLLRAGLRYDLGEREAAIAEIEGLIEEGLPPSEAGQARVALAFMYEARGDDEAARDLIETVVQDDPTQTDALKMLGRWLIEEDDIDGALQHLRVALDQNPDDPQTYGLMADAHLRAGARELARDFLSRAVLTSDAAVPETLRYVRVLMEDDRYALAEEALQTALRGAPEDVDLLVALGETYVRTDEWGQAERIEGRLRRIGTEAALDRADRLHAAILNGRGQSTEAMRFLEDLAQGAAGDGDRDAQIAVIRARLATGDVLGARAYAEGLLRDAPGDRTLRYALATVHAATGRSEEAEEIYRGLLDEDDREQAAWIGLIRALGAQNRTDDAREELRRALTVLPDAPDLLWAQASYLELIGDYPGAIALYEDLYDRLPNALVVANNLASLLSVYGEGDEDLERAYTIARRLRGSEVPQFRDTFGWIAYRRGNYEEALEHLEPAALALTTDPLVQYHLGMTYLAVDRPQDALRRLRRAVQLAGPRDPRPQFAAARAEIERLEAAGSETEVGR